MSLKSILSLAKKVLTKRMAVAAQTSQVASQFVLGKDGNLRASISQIWRTPPVIIPAAMAFFGVTLALVLGIFYYLHELEMAKKTHPDEVGYGHWYFTKFFQILFAILMSIFYVAITVVISLLTFAIIGPAEAQKYFQEKQQAQQSKNLNALEQEVQAIGNARVARFRQTRYGDQGGQELIAM